MLAYLEAALAAVSAAAMLTEFEHLEYWRRWDPAAVAYRLVVHYVPYVLLAVLGTALVRYFGIKPSGTDWVDGLAYAALIGAVAALPFVRRRLQKRAQRAAMRMDAAVRRSVPRHTGELRGEPLVEVSSMLFRRHVAEAPDMDRDLTLEHWEPVAAWQVTALTPVDPNDPTALHDHITAEGELRYYCEQLIVENHDATIHLPLRPFERPEVRRQKIRFGGGPPLFRESATRRKGSDDPRQ